MTMHSYAAETPHGTGTRTPRARAPSPTDQSKRSHSRRRCQ